MRSHIKQPHREGHLKKRPAIFKNERSRKSRQVWEASSDPDAKELWQANVTQDSESDALLPRILVRQLAELETREEHRININLLPLTTSQRFRTESPVGNTGRQIDNLLSNGSRIKFFLLRFQHFYKFMFWKCENIFKSQLDVKNRRE